MAKVARNKTAKGKQPRHPFDGLANRPSNAPDFAECKQIERVELVDAASITVYMSNDRVYLLPSGDLENADDSPIEKAELSEDHYHFKVTQSSGNWFEVPWDEVLYHCEPEYDYYKGRQAQKLFERKKSRIGDRLRELRLSKGLSISELAEMAGMKRPNLSRLEHGKHLPSLETLERLADALEVPVAQLLVREESP